MGRPKEFDEHEALMKAMRLFWVHGYKATSIQDLVDGMGIGRGSLYGTFGGKRSLFMRALRHYDQERAKQCYKDLSTSKPPRQAVLKPFESVAETVLDQWQFPRWLFPGQHGPGTLAARYRDRVRRGRRICRRGGVLPHHD